MRYVVFSGYADYPADMRNANSSIDLRPSRSSDYPADMQKLNVYNGLRRDPIFCDRGYRCARTSRRLPVSGIGAGLGLRRVVAPRVPRVAARHPA